MVRQKYVRFERLGFVVFPISEDVWHAHVGNHVRRYAGNVISAGFVVFKNGKAQCFGESESLGISSLLEDSELMTKQFETGN